MGRSNNTNIKMLILMFSILAIVGFSTTAIFVRASEMQPANPVYNSGTDATKWSYVYFGRYPQSEVTGDYLTDEIINGYYNTTDDTVVGGVKYRRVKATDTNTYKYFRFEPIKWKVLKVDENSLLLLSDEILDTLKEHPSSVNHILADYKSTKGRSWLNGYSGTENVDHVDYSKKGQNFQDIAFTIEEQDVLEIQSVGEDYDMVSIPSSSIVTDPSYGFTNGWDSSYVRKFSPTEYLISQFSYKYDSDTWTFYNKGKIDGVFSNGKLGSSIYNVSCYNYTPMIKINIHSNLWSMTEPEPSYETKSISPATVTLSKSVFTYDGTEKKPTAVTVKYNGEKLIEGTDYILKYSNSTNAGTATVSVIGVGDYSGTKNVDYTISKAEQSVSVSTNITKTYGDKAFKLNASRTAGDGVYSYQSGNQAVAEVSQYGTVTIRSAGTSKIVLTASETENYSEKRIEIILKVNKDSVSNASVTGLSDRTYSGNAWKPAPTVSINGRSLIGGTDYICTYLNNINSGTATIVIDGTGNYTGTKEVAFQINKVPISEAIVTGVRDQTYNGRAWNPVPVVNINGTILNVGTDYVCSYFNNVNSGTATITISGTGNYSGVKNVSFQINKSEQDLVVKNKKVKISYKKLKKKKQTIKASTVTKGNVSKTKIIYKLIKANKRKASFKVASSGKIIIKKGTKRGTYKLTIRATATEGTNYTGSLKNCLVTVKIK